MRDWATHFQGVSSSSPRTASFGEVMPLGAPAPLDTLTVTKEPSFTSGWGLPLLGVVGFALAWVGGYAFSRAQVDQERHERALRHYTARAQ
jgi:hypothetical protein